MGQDVTRQLLQYTHTCWCDSHHNSVPVRDWGGHSAQRSDFLLLPRSGRPWRAPTAGSCLEPSPLQHLPTQQVSAGPTNENTFRWISQKVRSFGRGACIASGVTDPRIGWAAFVRFFFATNLLRYFDQGWLKT